MSEHDDSIKTEVDPLHREAARLYHGGFGSLRECITHARAILGMPARDRMDNVLDNLRDLIQSEGWPDGRRGGCGSTALSEALEVGEIRVSPDEMAFWSANHNVLIVVPSADLAEGLNEMDWEPLA